MPLGSKPRGAVPRSASEPSPGNHELHGRIEKIDSPNHPTRYKNNVACSENARDSCSQHHDFCRHEFPLARPPENIADCCQKCSDGLDEPQICFWTRHPNETSEMHQWPNACHEIE